MQGNKKTPPPEDMLPPLTNARPNTHPHCCVIQVCEICKAQASSSRDREAKPRAQGTIWLQTAQIS